ncbi:hypothetical protein A3K93_01810 [Acinetobacter sp. NCu2D-2]|uniref:DUF2971 domain-containing protein n=1 Tax=Acinetobacter sp. NCu2D-2 TaxID=1608473 RepID=UPI0007CDC521|nr:DUF2971 domain-containing protein [Acinetobacter sp. NCu2D-2]ANF81050.1 hypothetical protein A3K93_01810 [Acinetobacter sp. NCu2D-2]
MILYKYLSFDIGLKVIKSNTIGFSQVRNFNDPFESTAFGFKENVLSIFDQVASFRNHFSNNYAVLSLTECHLNPLMWAHYAQSHTGLVIAINVDKAKLNDNNFIISAKNGKIHYQSNLELLDYDNETMSEKLYQIGNDQYYSLDGCGADILRKAFLMKQKSWEYEKEVRIVKNIKASKLYFDPKQEYDNRKSFNSEES